MCIMCCQPSQIVPKLIEGHVPHEYTLLPRYSPFKSISFGLVWSRSGSWGLPYSLMLNWPPDCTIRKVRFLKNFHRHNSVTTQRIVMKLTVLYWIGNWNLYTEFQLDWLRDDLVMALKSSSCGLFRMVGLFRTREYNKGRQTFGPEWVTWSTS